MVKNLLANARDTGSIPVLARSPGEENGNPLQYSYLENSMDREAWRAIVRKIAKRRIGEGNGNPLQYSCLENPMDGGAWWAAVHGVAKSQTRLSDFTMTFHFHALEKEMKLTPVFLPGESQGRGAWWAAVYGVAQSRTRLK